jgi:hypothetical protein
MRPTIRERLVAIRIRLQIRLGLLQYGRQADGSVGTVVVPQRFHASGIVAAKIYKAATDEWRDFGTIASPKPSLLKRIIYARRIKKANQWLAS